MRRAIPTALGTLMLLLPLGCKKDPVVIPQQPQPPGLIGSVIPSQDTTDARSLGVVRVTFAWTTDSTSTDVIYYGPVPEYQPESLLALNLNQGSPTGVFHLHTAPIPPAQLTLDTNQVIFYRVRSRGVVLSGFSEVARFRAFRPPH